MERGTVLFTNDILSTNRIYIIYTNPRILTSELVAFLSNSNSTTLHDYSYIIMESQCGHSMLINKVKIINIKPVFYR